MKDNVGGNGLYDSGDEGEAGDVIPPSRPITERLTLFSFCLEALYAKKCIFKVNATATLIQKEFGLYTYNINHNDKRLVQQLAESPSFCNIL